MTTENQAPEGGPEAPAVWTWPAGECHFAEIADNGETPHLRIKMGHGRIEVGDAVHDGLPALWFGNDGQGLGFERDRNDKAKPNETILIVTFENLAGLEAIEFAVTRVRAKMEAAALAAQQPTDAELERRTGEPHVDGWPLVSGLPAPQTEEHKA